MEQTKSEIWKCKYCRWWEMIGASEYKAGFLKGNCRKNCPISNYDWPKTLENDFCGQWEEVLPKNKK